MFNNRRALWAVLLVLGIAMLYPHAKGMAESKNTSVPENEFAIHFGDPTHVLFFNHQNYLTQHKSAGETPETWNVLSSLERLKKVKDGEALLERLHAELVAKQVRTPEEEALFQAVWGKTNLAAASNVIPEAAMVKQAPPATAAVAALSQKIGGVQNWNFTFDGRQHSSAVDGNVGAASTNLNRSDTEIIAAKAVAPKHIDQGAVPLANRGSENAPVKRTLPLVGGVAMLAAAYYALKGKPAQAEGSPLGKLSAVESPAEVQIKALHELIAAPERRAEFLENPGAYAARHGVSFDPEVAQMTRSTLLKYEQELSRLESGNPYQLASDEGDDAARGVTTLAASAAVAAGAAVISAVAAATQATSAAKAAK